MSASSLNVGSIPYSSTSNLYDFPTNNVTVTNTGTTSMDLYAQMGTLSSTGNSADSNLTEAYNDTPQYLSSGQVELYAATGGNASGETNQAVETSSSTAPSPVMDITTNAVTSLASGASASVSIAFYLGSSTPPATYTIPVMYTVS